MIVWANLHVLGNWAHRQSNTSVATVLWWYTTILKVSDTDFRLYYDADGPAGRFLCVAVPLQPQAAKSCEDIYAPPSTHARSCILPKYISLVVL
jgi:hypothetical protein